MKLNEIKTDSKLKKEKELEEEQAQAKEKLLEEG